MRYLCEYIRPGYGTPSPGMNNMWTDEYVSDKNAMRYMALRLAKLDHMPPGQYIVSRWPQHGDEIFVGHIYKRV